LVPVLAVFMGWDKLGGRKEVLPNASLSIMALTCVIYGRRSRAPQVKLQCVAISQRGRRRCDEGSRELRLYLSRWCFGEVCVACRSSTQLSTREPLVPTWCSALAGGARRGPHIGFLWHDSRQSTARPHRGVTPATAVCTCYWGPVGKQREHIPAACDRCEVLWAFACYRVAVSCAEGYPPPASGLSREE